MNIKRGTAILTLCLVLTGMLSTTAYGVTTTTKKPTTVKKAVVKKPVVKKPVVKKTAPAKKSTSEGFPFEGKLCTEAQAKKPAVKIGALKITDASGLTKEQQDKLNESLKLWRTWYDIWVKEGKSYEYDDFNHAYAAACDASIACRDMLLEAGIQWGEVKNSEIRAYIDETQYIVATVTNYCYVWAKKLGYKSCWDFLTSYNGQTNCLNLILTSLTALYSSWDNYLTGKGWCTQGQI